MGMFSVLSAFDFCFPLFFIVLFIYFNTLWTCGDFKVYKDRRKMASTQHVYLSLSILITQARCRHK